ncbi:MAG: gamma-glutamyltransferase, partial [Oscillospiraceae bacterium]
LSSMSPTIVLTPEGKPFLIVGSPGGTKIFTTVAQVIVKAIDYKMSVQDAIDSPRIWDSHAEKILYENSIPKAEVDKLVAMGHEVTDTAEWSRSLGSVNAVLYGDDGVLYGGADPRRDGKALGY